MKSANLEDKFILSINRGEKIVEKLEEWCNQEGVVNAFFVGIGAVDEAELAHYSVEDKKYSSFKLNEALELVNLTGNVFRGPEKLIVHAHATLSRPEGETVAGHLVEAQISGAGEILIWKLGSEFGKEYDEETGLKLLEL